MDTCSVVGGQEDCDEITIDQKPFSQESLNEWDENMVELLPSQTISLSLFNTSLSSSPSTAVDTSGTPVPSESLVSRVNELTEQLVSAQKTIEWQREKLVEARAIIIELKAADLCDIADLKNLVGQERKQRLEAEEKVASLEDSLKSYDEKYTRIMKRVRELWMEEEEPPAQNIQSKTNANLEIPTTQPINEDTVITPKENNQKDAEMPCKSAASVAAPLVIDIPDDDEDSLPLSPPQSPIDSDVDIEEISAMSISKDSESAQLVERESTAAHPPGDTMPEILPHGYAMEDHELGIFYCSCGSNYESMRNLRRHIIYMTKEPKIACSICERRFLYQCYLIKHLKGAHKIVEGDMVTSRSANSAQRPKRIRKIERGDDYDDAVESRSSRMRNEQTIKKSCQHRQISNSLLDKFTCACGNKYARKPGLLKHIENFQNK